MKFKKLITPLLIMLAAFYSNSIVYSQCPSGLIGYWKMDEISGTNLVDVIAGQNATRNITTGLIDGKIDNSQRFTYNFTGVCKEDFHYTYAEYASVSNNSAFNFGHNSSFTISYWIRFRDCGEGCQDHIAISKGDWGNGGGPADGMFASGLNGSCKINFLLRDDTGNKVDLEKKYESFDTEKWHHVACVRDEATERNILYVNGVLKDDSVHNYAGGFSTLMNLEFANLVNGGEHGYFLRGDLDEVAIFNRALSLSEINQIKADVEAGIGLCSVSTPPDITSTPVTNGKVDEAYSYDVNATGSATIAYSLTTAPAGMSVNASTGVISWTPATGGNYNVTVKAENGNDPFDTQSFTITVTGDNPTITSTPVTTGTVEEAYSYDVNAIGTQTGMTYSLSLKPTGMTINATSGLIAWTPDAPGSFSVRVKADNGIAPADSQSFTITVAGINPKITSAAVTTAFVGALYSYTVHATGKQIGMTYSLSVKPVGMTINSGSGLISWTPAAPGSATVRVKAENGIAPADSQSFTINITEESLCPDGIISLHKLDESSGPNYADYYDEHNAMASVSPTATTGIIGGAQLFNASTKINIPDNGTEFDWLSGYSFSIECWMKTSTTAGMACVARNRTDYANTASWWIGTNPSGYAVFELRDNGNHIKTLPGNSRVDDGQWHHIIGVRDAATNTNKIFVDGVLEASSSMTYYNSFKADDPLAVSIGYLIPYGGENELHFIGAIDEVAIFNRAVSPSEASSYYNGGTPTGHCKGNNNPPYFTSTPTVSAAEDSPYTYTATVNDADASDILAISVITKPTWLNFSYTAGQKNATLSGTPSNFNVGENDVFLRVSDGDISRDQLFRIVVTNLNDAPVKTSTPPTAVNEDALYSYTLTVTDADEYDTISMTATTKPSWLTFTHAFGARTATLTGTPANANVGANPVTISITDGKVTILESYTITVSPVNDPPVIISQNALSVNEDQSITILKSDLTINDIDNPQADITITVQAGTYYTFIGNTVTPAANYNGQLSVNVKANDLVSSGDIYPVLVTVNPVNDSPVVTSTPITTAEEGTLYSYTLTVTDVDAGDQINMTAITKPSWLTLNHSAVSKTATLTGTPAHTDLGANSVFISITDGNATINHQYTINVAVQNVAPVITGQSALSVIEDNSIEILKSNLTITDSDNPANDISIHVQAGTNYTFSGNIVTPASNFNGQLLVNVKAFDKSKYSNNYPVIVTVTPVNDKPLVTYAPDTTALVGVLYAYVFLANDAEAETLTKTIITKPDWLDFNSTSGALTGFPGISDIGIHDVSLRVSDGTNTVKLEYSIFVYETTAVIETQNNQFALYPVPVKGELNIRFNYLSEETLVEIFSSTGAVFESVKVAANTVHAVIPLPNIDGGIYICRIKNSTINATSKFMVVE